MTALPKFHPRFDFDGCPICQHPDRDALESFYIDRKSIASLTKTFGVTKKEIEQHCEALELHFERLKNTPAAEAQLVDIGMEEAVEKGVPVAELRKILQHIDVKEGRVVHRVRAERPRLLVGATSPSPGLPQPAPDAEELKALEADFKDASS